MNAAQFMVHVAWRQKETDYEAAQRGRRLADRAVSLNKSAEDMPRLKAHRDSLYRIEGRLLWERICRQNQALERLGIEMD